LSAPPLPARSASVDPTLFPEAQRAFFQDGPALLMTPERRDELLALDEARRGAAIDAFLVDPRPETPDNELAAAIRRRQDVAASYALGFADDRARVAFLHGAPSKVEALDCGQAFKALELWQVPGLLRTLVFYRPEATAPYRLWRPFDGKRALYVPDMEYWLEQWDEYGSRMRGKRFDRQVCPLSEAVDKATGVDGMFAFEATRPKQADLDAVVAAPQDLAVWVTAALGAPVLLPAAPNSPPATSATAPPAATVASGGPLLAGPLTLQFPEKRGQRIVVRGLIQVPPEAGLEPFLVKEDEGSGSGLAAPAPDAAAAAASPAAAAQAPPAAAVPPTGDAPPASGRPELRLAVDGVVEQGGRVFESFSIRYRPPPPPAGTPLELQLERALRPHETFLLRVRLRDELTGREVRLARGFTVPERAVPVPVPALPAAAVVALGEEMAERRIPGRDSLIVVPPSEDVLLGLWRAEALVTGERIAKVVFLLDGKVQLTRSRPPWSAEVRLSQFPVEQTVRAEGYDAAGQLVAADEVVLNQPRGALRVRILQPPRGKTVTGRAAATAEVVVPEGRKVTSVEFKVNDTVAATLVRPPWETPVDVPPSTDVVYLTVTAVLDDGSQAEDFRFLNAPQYVDEVNVDLVELFTTVLGSNGRPATGLPREAFTVLEDGVEQRLARFEAVEDLPLNLGMVLDTSGSMVTSLAQAQIAAKEFLASVMTPRDRAFVLSFSDQPTMLMPPTEDLVALQGSLAGLQAYGYTALHDAMMTGLYYFRGIRGRRALILLSDGDDTSSATPYRDLLEYARRSGVTIYPIGLNVGPLDLGIRGKLDELAKETGGRVFYATDASALVGVYGEINRELRSQYLLAYPSNSKRPSGQFRKVEVKVKGSGMKARTLGGYYP
jgi:Ca-activated chloride channel family protein